MWFYENYAMLIHINFYKIACLHALCYLDYQPLTSENLALLNGLHIMSATRAFKNLVNSMIHICSDLTVE